MSEKKCSDRAGRGISHAVMSAVFYFVLPVLFFHFAVPMVPPEVDLAQISELMERWFLAGIPMVAISFFVGYYGMGNISKVYAWIASAAMSLVWLLYVSNTGDLAGLVVYENADFRLTLGMSVLGLIVIAAALKLLKFMVVYCDYRDNRAEYAGNGPSGGMGRDTPIRVKGKYD